MSEVDSGHVKMVIVCGGIFLAPTRRRYGTFQKDKVSDVDVDNGLHGICGGRGTP